MNDDRTFKLAQLYAKPWAFAKSYEIPAFKGEWLEYISGDFFSYPIPTEVVVTSSQIVTPRMGRVYRTNLRNVGGVPMDHFEINKKVKRQGYEFDYIVVAEVWDDRGSDGHVRWTHVGWRFIVSRAVEWKWRTWQGDIVGPEAMRVQDFDYDWRA